MGIQGTIQFFKIDFCLNLGLERVGVLFLNYKNFLTKLKIKNY